MERGGAMNEYGNGLSDLRVNIERSGLGPEAIDEVSQALAEHASVQEQLSETRSRLLSVELLYPVGADN
jgi:hypothetical protein